MKEAVKSWLLRHNYEIEDLGTNSQDSVDYPDFAHKLAAEVESGAAERGLLLCGSGNGVCMSANKHHGIRAALAWNAEIAALAVMHNNSNVLCLPARFIDEEEAKNIVHAYLSAQFEGGRHQRRVEKIDNVG